MTSTELQLSDIQDGTPATVLYPNDTRAAVVVRRTPKKVYVARVETTNRRRESDRLAEGEMPVILEDGILDQPVGPGLLYTLKVDGAGRPYAERDGQRVRFGHSVTRIVYKI